MRSVLDLPTTYKKLSPAARKRFDSIFSFNLDEGRMVIPKSMKPWAKKQFGSVAKLEKQPILKVTNEVVYEGALFNKLRADRPIQSAKSITQKELLALAKKGPFGDVEANTPEDTFGRLYGRSEISASNVAKYDALHGLIIFNKADPLAFTEAETIDHYNAALSWIAAANSEHPDAIYPVIGWNCLWKAAASLVHGHMQVLVAKEPYAAAKLWKEAATTYKKKYKKDYWKELFAVHESLGLGVEKKGVKVFASLTPKKEKEVMLLADDADEAFFSALFRVLKCYRELGVDSFNVAMILPALKGKGLPAIARIVDRGELDARTTDIGIMELYLGQSVVSSDPAKLWAKLRRFL
ncbi:hypothetical protein GOV07_00710 [Candidatus Woesearchaeota archaeon]|nr:hypothetical protein [Candidatus Woesearchaeota archaeon]